MYVYLSLSLSIRMYMNIEPYTKVKGLRLKWARVFGHRLATHVLGSGCRKVANW